MPQTHTNDDRADRRDQTHDLPRQHNNRSHFRQRLSHQRTRLLALVNQALCNLLGSLPARTLRSRFKHAATSQTEPAPLAPHLELGRRGELLAAERLRREGYLPVAANFKLNVGRDRRGALVQAELDLVAYDGPVLCFVEVKTRASDRFAAPEANVDLRKQRQLARAARAYRRLLGLRAAPYRYDVVSVLLPPPARPGDTAPPPRIRLLRNFFNDAKFRKRRWHDPADDH